MEFGYLHVRCGPYRILVPGDNVASIDPMPELGAHRPSLRQARALGCALIIDGRTLLGLAVAGPSDPRVIIHWTSARFTADAALVVDGVEGLRGGYDAEFLPLPRVPPDFNALFDGLVYEADGAFLLRLRRDARPILDGVNCRRRYCRAVIGAVHPVDLSRAGE
jgi:hypothetical protein